MGTNRRYADAVDRRTNEKALVTIARGAELQTLTPAELRLDEVSLTVDPRPRPRPRRKVKAWVQFGAVPVQVNAVAARWTPDGVGIVFRVEETEYRCWVCVGAVYETTG